MKNILSNSKKYFLQLEEAEYNRAAAVKAKQSKELELGELQSQLEDTSRGRKLAEDKAAKVRGWLCKYFLLHLQIFSPQLARDKSELSAQLQENEEELAEVIRKYKSSVSTISQDQLTIQNQAQHVQVSRQE